jgi:ABC-type glycerol-3-phosphate transport system substrate-binding protein
MKLGLENRKKVIQASVFGVLALASIIYMVSQLSGSDASSSDPTAVTVTVPASSGGGSKPAAKVASSTTKLDPTLHMEGMELAESITYTGSGRNIFSANSAPAVVIPKAIASARSKGAQAQAPVNLGPPPPPPIDLKFFGTATKKDGSRRAFLLHGDDVFIASPGDIVNRRYKINSVSANSVEVTDLQNSNTQRLPLSVN